MQLFIRDANLGDHEAIETLYREADTIAHELLPRFFKHPIEFGRDKEEFLRQIQDKSTALIVAEDDRGVIGLSMTVLQQTSASLHDGFARRTYAELVNLILSSAARREGIASKLVATAENWAKSSGAESIDLTVVEGNGGAQQLYENFGFFMRSHRMWKLLD